MNHRVKNMAKESLLERTKESVQNDDTDENNGGGGDGETDYEEFAIAKVNPTTVITGEIEALWYTGDVSDTQQDRNSGDGDFGVRLRNPSVPDDSIARSTDKDDSETGLSKDADDGQYLDYKVFDSSDEGTDLVERDGVFFGVETPNSSSFDSEVVDEFDEDVIDVYVGGTTASQRLGELLDVSGANSAHGYEGGYSGGLIEYPEGYGSGDTDMSPRVARNPILRDDLEGQEVEILLARRELVDEDYEGQGYWLEIYVDDEQVEPVVGDVPEDTYVNVEWHDIDFDDGDGGAGGAASDESTGAYGEFDEDAQELIEETVTRVNDPEEDITAEAFDGTAGIERHVEANLGDVDEGRKQAIAGAIQDEIDA